MTEPGKNAPGLTGFPTPNTAAGIPAYLLFLFNDPSWAQWVLGALEPMVYEQNWYCSGDLEPFEASEAFREIIQQAPYNLQSGGEIPAPFWDEASDADAEAEPDEQTWYGTYDGTFHETLENWAIAGFIAASGQPAAAVYFLTIAPRFRLAWRKGDVGGVIRVFINAADYGTVDTAGDPSEIVTMDIVGDPDADEQAVLLVRES